MNGDKNLKCFHPQCYLPEHASNSSAEGFSMFQGFCCCRCLRHFGLIYNSVCNPVIDEELTKDLKLSKHGLKCSGCKETIATKTQIKRLKQNGYATDHLSADT